VSNTIRSFCCVIVFMFVAGCISHEEIDELRKNQHTLKKSLDSIVKNQQQMLKTLDRIARQKQVPPRKPVKKPDPKETYSFAVGSSPVKGAKDAWVTIVEVSEFQ